MVYSGVTTQLAEMIPVIVLSGAVTGMLGQTQAYTKRGASQTFSEASYREAADTFGKSTVDIAKKNPNTIFHTDEGEIMYSDGKYFVR